MKTRCPQWVPGLFFCRPWPTRRRPCALHLFARFCTTLRLPQSCGSHLKDEVHHGKQTANPAPWTTLEQGQPITPRFFVRHGEAVRSPRKAHGNPEPRQGRRAANSGLHREGHQFTSLIDALKARAARCRAFDLSVHDQPEQAVHQSTHLVQRHHIRSIRPRSIRVWVRLHE